MASSNQENLLVCFCEISKEVLKEIIVKSILENTILFIIWFILFLGFVIYEIYKLYYHKKKVDPVIEQYIKENPKTALLIAQSNNKTSCNIKYIKRGIKEYKKGIFLLRIRMCAGKNQYIKEFTNLFNKSTFDDFGVYFVFINSTNLEQPIHINGCIDNKKQLSNLDNVAISPHHYYNVFYAIKPDIIDQLELGKHHLQININGKGFMYNNFYIT